MSVELLRTACGCDLGDPALWPAPTSYPHSLALSIIDAIYVTGSRHSTVDKIVSRYRSYRADEGGDADTDGVPELLANVDAHGGPESWATVIGNRRPTSTAKNAPLRAVALAEVAQALSEAGIETTADLRVADDELRDRAGAAWCAVPGQRSGFTWGYLQMLIQLPGVTVDRSVAGYVTRAVGAEEQPAALLHRVAEVSGWDVVALHNAIWRFESCVGRNPDAAPRVGTTCEPASA